jgi:membrane protein DedA with SNARE-associated domain
MGPVLAYSLVEKIVDWVQPVFVTAGYLIIAGAVLMERSIFIGLIVPGDLILALGGVYSSQHKMNLVLVIVIGTLAAISGESIGYWLGRRYGAGMIRHIPLIRRLEGQLETSQEYFKRHGGKTVALGRYATAAGAFIPFSAGVGRMPYRRFLLFDIPAIVIWAAGISIFGYAFGQHLDFVDKVLSRFGYGVLILFVLLFGGRFAWKRIKEKRQARRPRRTKTTNPR